MRIRHKLQVNSQYFGATCQAEGGVAGAGVCFRISNGTPTILVRDATGLTVFTKNATGISLIDNQDVHFQCSIKDSVDGIVPGWGFIKVDNVVVWEGEVIYGNDGTVGNTWHPPSAGAAQHRFAFGINGIAVSGSIRRWLSGTRVYFAQFGEGGGKLDESYVRPSGNSTQWRSDGNVF
jgi:hypothetical protein